VIGLMFSGITIPLIIALFLCGPTCNSALSEKMDPELSAGCRPTHGLETTVVPLPASLGRGLLHLVAGLAAIGFRESDLAFLSLHTQIGLFHFPGTELFLNLVRIHFV
jgi:hypothetical protein